MKLKKGDQALVIAGKDSGKKGKILEVNVKANKVIVENVNIVSKHQKPKSQQDKGGIIKKAAAFDASNVMVICPVCGKATRVAHKDINGKNVRVCKKCGASLDKDYKVATKKAEKTVKADKVEKVEAEVKTEVKTEKPATVKKPTTAKTTTKTTTAKKPAAKKSAEAK